MVMLYNDVSQPFRVFPASHLSIPFTNFTNQMMGIVDVILMLFGFLHTAWEDYR